MLPVPDLTGQTHVLGVEKVVTEGIAGTQGKRGNRVGNSAHSRGLGTRWTLRSLQSKPFYDSTLQSIRFTRRPRSCASTKEPPLQAPFAQKTWISKGKYWLQLLVCMDEFNFYQKQLQVVTVNSYPTLILNQASNRLRLDLQTRPALVVQLQLCRSYRTPYVQSISPTLIPPSW